jgi:Ca2+-binding EF-hand superfamily protein
VRSCLTACACAIACEQKSWDRNQDGVISKQEFRLQVRNLGLSDHDLTPTKEIDELFDSVDLDKSGSLDLGQARLLLQKLKVQVSEAYAEKMLFKHTLDIKQTVVQPYAVCPTRL